MALLTVVRLLRSVVGIVVHLLWLVVVILLLITRLIHPHIRTTHIRATHVRTAHIRTHVGAHIRATHTIVGHSLRSTLQDIQYKIQLMYIYTL